MNELTNKFESLKLINFFFVSKLNKKKAKPPSIAFKIKNENERKEKKRKQQFTKFSIALGYKPYCILENFIFSNTII